MQEELTQKRSSMSEKQYLDFVVHHLVARSWFPLAAHNTSTNVRSIVSCNYL